MSILTKIAEGVDLKSAIQNAKKDTQETAQEAENKESNWEYLPGKSSYKNKVTGKIIDDDEYQKKFGAFTTSKTNHVGE